MKANRDRSVKITPEMIHQAGENLILRRETHIDQLADKLTEKRVQRVIGPIHRRQNGMWINRENLTWKSS
ncbi:Uncharacterized protein dnl_43980 [Desulfonema limicola]|uniref:Uncharacterized protein n=1 Tax=Desulfonema limicola TaxID=45656 RepID=A0A975GHY1_9BACT|nr:hypothetical protein [Desulfonema limicola]QTA82035.1 Uncharacterized protein dnl_43980 [Desulfonema limicola]